MEISAVWLISEEKDMVVLIEVDDKWYELIRTFGPLGEMTISHCAHVKNGLPPDVEEVDSGQPGVAMDKRLLAF